MTEEPAAAPPPAKVDPETLVIRARPRRAIRFRRGVIVAIAALGSVSLIVVAWVALKPVSLRRVVDQEESQPAARPASDALNGLPASYAQTPKLGTPLPGDLGRPILDHQRSFEAPADVSRQQAEQMIAAERERSAAELKAARESGVLFQNRQAVAPDPAAQATSAPASVDTAAAPSGSKVALDPDRDPNAQGHKADSPARWTEAAP